VTERVGGTVPDVDAVTTARDVVAEHFAGQTAAGLVALLAGSSARGDTRGTSDLDIVVVLAPPATPYRETLRVRGQLVELFVQTDVSARRCWEREAAERRNTLADMCAHGVVLAGAERAEALRLDAAAHLARGPAALAVAELERRRYAITDGLDDLGDAADAGDADERDAVAGMLLVGVGELALAARRQWLGRGKWLIRRLRAVDRPLADRLLAAHRRVVGNGVVDDLITVADEVLAGVGGRLSEGYYAD
jgi:predicted nucleotidyltransferase